MPNPPLRDTNGDAIDRLPDAVARALRGLEGRVEARLNVIEDAQIGDHAALFGRGQFEGDTGLTGRLLDNEKAIRHQLQRLSRLAVGVLVTMLTVALGLAANLGYHIVTGR